MKIKIGIAPIAWSNDDMPELGGDTPIEICLGEAKKAGFSGIELGGKFPRNPGITNWNTKPLGTLAQVPWRREILEYKTGIQNQ